MFNKSIVVTSFPFSLSLPFFLIFQGKKKLLLWNTRANGDATKENLFHTLERDVDIGTVEWISANRIALGLVNGLIEIWQIDEEGETTNSRVIKRFKCGSKYVSLRIRRFYNCLTNFCFSFLEADNGPEME